MVAVKYVNILFDNLEISANKMGLKEYIFQQDIEPKCTTKLTKQWFSIKKIKVLPWSPQSPDLNPIEDLQAFIKSKICTFQPKNINELKSIILSEWSSIISETCQKYSDSFTKRISEVLKIKGKHIKY